ncbi:hypothetical protein CDAR_107601 [Caerostris darwini]|uniref:Uncharacterized protein n=1 Tax=Caerostris darwini TaxID=1538125 RepID=A0AAV4X787_9ARAC|nr:hypothetical protein CDAR_107601 [Caerostris darwini]
MGQWSGEKLSAKEVPESTGKEPSGEDRGSMEKVPSREHRGSISKVPLGQDRASIERSSVKDLLNRRKTLSTITQWDTKKEPTKDYRSGAERR